MGCTAIKPDPSVQRRGALHDPHVHRSARLALAARMALHAAWLRPHVIASVLSSIEVTTTEAGRYAGALCRCGAASTAAGLRHRGVNGFSPDSEPRAGPRRALGPIRDCRAVSLKWRRGPRETHGPAAGGGGRGLSVA